MFGQQDGVWVGVPCKPKDGLLRTNVTVAELNAEVEATEVARSIRAVLSNPSPEPRPSAARRERCFQW